MAAEWCVCYFSRCSFPLHCLFYNVFRFESLQMCVCVCSTMFCFVFVITVAIALTFVVVGERGWWLLVCAFCFCFAASID
ncbi:hypothetical protein TRSC58_07502 [Trypanosoma rangeli SC58]|uniref:Uncharacterized protein n=1 Tax=Trypanosoma rangeli SC58 TaxID=429131 RepID=A0A061ISP9_TRYRA|nr:hypothetical protein TRSC58_07502 [Trypanosoma rangeli SC58]